MTTKSDKVVLGLATAHHEIDKTCRYVNERPHRYHRQLMSVFVSAVSSVPPAPPANLKCNKMRSKAKTGAEYQNSNRLEVLHLFRWFTHTHHINTTYFEQYIDKVDMV